MRPLMAALIISFMIIGLAPSAHADETLMIQVHHGLLLKVNNVERVVVAAPDIADVNIITRTQLMVVAKKVGETMISVWDARGYTAYRVVISNGAGADIIKTLTETLREPGVTVKVVGDAVVLEGTVKTEADKSRAESIASAFGKKVINVLKVEQAAPRPPSSTQVLEAQVREALKDQPVVIKVMRNAANEDVLVIEGTAASQAELARIEAIVKALAKNAVLLVRIREPLQIQLDATFVEIDKQALQQMGVEWGGGSQTTPAAGTPTLAPVLTDPFAFHFGFFDPGNPLTPLQILVSRLRLLESRGAARTLSNPRLVVLEGRPAKLLVGGELPVPIVTSTGTAVTFKEFGIRLEFKPIVEGRDSITLDLDTEVSTLDFSNPIVAAGFVIPTIRKRRVQTMVVMRPGEFLILGGLIQRDANVNVVKIPLLGDLPIIGSLFRSARFQRGETELVIFVSPGMVTPSRTAPQLPAEPSSPLPPPSTSP